MTMRRWRTVAGSAVAAACLLVAVSPASSATGRSDSYQARVTRVVDGDTVWVKPLDGGKYRKLRIEGIDAPEICQEGGLASREALSVRILDKTVSVEVHRFDDYGRALVRLELDGDDVARWLVVQGQAWSYRWRHSLGPYREEEALAREHRKGLFGRPDPEEPRDFRRRHGPCTNPPSGVSAPANRASGIPG